MHWVLGFPVGFLLGVVLQRGDFCMHSVVREVLGGRPGPQARGYLVALGVQVAVVNALAATGGLILSFPDPAPAAAAGGGLIFGIGMVLTKG